MLHLQCETPARWLEQVDADLSSILIDHAHCEKKAAGTALNLIFAYVEDVELCREMTEIVNEELEHFHLVLDLLARRGIRFRRLTPSSYGRELNNLARKQEPQRAVDRLLVAGLIEARSCERFHVLAQHVKDSELSEFYGSLFESEARHHTTYTRLAKHFAPEADVMRRLDELAAAEAVIITRGEDLPRMHS
ncbi:MAG TPA: tRNA-(ms[2]io[6]A)-hydroxylase [Lacipirellulaceae bacterium]|jgi:tRNA-(ms[2]io[6]A)-hydroxylase|nr:tRNA-(ms[2]io[6]A)-hydroxylase [Lacipirellulaceae bacterium]